MSKLEELIQELCSNGVEYCKVGDIADYEQPTKYIVESTKYSDDFNIPVLTAGQTFILGYINETHGIYEASKENPVIIFDDFTGAFKWVDFPFKVKSSAMKIIHTKENKAYLRYIYHLMSFLNYMSDEHKRLWIGIYSEFLVPIPPLPVQAEIIRILDNFTELTAELTARKKQYEYYRNEMLNFGDDVDYKYIEEIFDVKNGYTPSKNNQEFWENGTIPWFRMEDIRSNGRYLKDAIQHISTKAVKGGKLFPSGSIIISTTATIGEHALINVDALTNQQMTCLTLKTEYKKKLNNKFVFFYCYVLGEWCKKNVNNGGSLPIIGIEKIKKFRFPIPTLEEQKRIVSILDRFDKLCNDISEGLPAEIAARQKQYEYYRDKLLTFKENTNG